MQFSFVRPSITDIPGIKKLLEKTYLDTFVKNGIDGIFEIKEEIENKIGKLEKDIIENDANYYFAIAKHEMEIVGICAHFPISEIIAENIKGVQSRELEIGCTYVHPEYQKKGIGKALFKMTVEELRRKHIDHYYLCSGFETSQNYWNGILGNPICAVRDIWGKGKHELIWRIEL
jgi:GNAT superfamily N-acetyltransferase